MAGSKSWRSVARDRQDRLDPRPPVLRRAGDDPQILGELDLATTVGVTAGAETDAGDGEAMPTQLYSRHVIDGHFLC
jgi:hypothetical protein